MTNERYNELMNNVLLSLTPEEIALGWHFCNEFDGLLVLGDPNEPICGDACIKAEDGRTNDN